MYTYYQECGEELYQINGIVCHENWGWSMLVPGRAGDKHACCLGEEADSPRGYSWLSAADRQRLLTCKWVMRLLKSPLLRKGKKSVRT